MCIDSTNIDKDILDFLRYHAERNISIFIQFLLRHLFNLSEIKKIWFSTSWEYNQTSKYKMINITQTKKQEKQKPQSKQ